MRIHSRPRKRCRREAFGGTHSRKLLSGAGECVSGAQAMTTTQPVPSGPRFNRPGSSKNEACLACSHCFRVAQFRDCFGFVGLRQVWAGLSRPIITIRFFAISSPSFLDFPFCADTLGWAGRQAEVPRSRRASHVTLLGYPGENFQGPHWAVGRLTFNSVLNRE